MANIRVALSQGVVATGNEHFSSVGEQISRWLTASLDRLLDRLERGRERAALAQMDDRALKDIGLTRSDLAHPRR